MNTELVNIQFPHSTVKTLIPGLLFYYEMCSQKKSASSLAMRPGRQEIWWRL